MGVRRFSRKIKSSDVPIARAESSAARIGGEIGFGFSVGTQRANHVSDSSARRTFGTPRFARSSGIVAGRWQEA